MCLLSLLGPQSPSQSTTPFLGMSECECQVKETGFLGFPAISIYFYFIRTHTYIYIILLRHLHYLRTFEKGGKGFSSCLIFLSHGAIGLHGFMHGPSGL